MGSWNKRTKEEIEEIVNNLGYDLLNNYIVENYMRKVVIRDKWGYKYDVVFTDLARGKIPDFVGKGNPNTLENISLWLIQEEKLFELCKDSEYMGAKKNIFFHCLIPECNENFDMSWDAIYSQGQGCPYCSGRRVSDKNRLSIIRPDLADEWDYELNEDFPKDVSFGLSKYRWWICPMGHESYLSRINNRTSGKGC